MIYIYQLLLYKERVLILSYLSIYSYIHLYLHGLFPVFLQFRICYQNYHNAQIVLYLDSRFPFKLACQKSPLVEPKSYLTAQKDVPDLFWTFPTPVLKLAMSLRNTSFLQWIMFIWNQGSGTWDHCYCDVTSSRST